MISVSLDVTSTIRGLESIGRQAIYAASVALNQVANEAQRVQQEAVQRDFTLRQTRFILNTIKRSRGSDFATKDRLTAAVRIDETRNFLAKHEEEGEKHAIQGKDYVAVPLPGIKRTKRDLIPRKFYPSAFKPFVDHNGIATGRERTFIVPTKSGNRLLLQRYGGKRGRAGVRPLYLFVPSVHIDGRLHFHEHAIAAARASWAPSFRRAFVDALRTAR